MIIDKKKAKQLTKIIHQLKNHNIPLDDVFVGTETLLAINNAIQERIKRE